MCLAGLEALKPQGPEGADAGAVELASVVEKPVDFLHAGKVVYFVGHDQ